MEKQKCEGCTYWRPICSSNSGSAYMACNYFFETGKTRHSAGAWGECIVREERKCEKNITRGGGT